MARYIGQYEIIKELGEGHFGAVYLAVGDVPGRRGGPSKKRIVAIKKLKNGASPEAVEQLNQEFALLDQVKHRCIVRVYEYLDDEDAVVMEYIHGVSLRTLFDGLLKAHEQVFTEAAIEIGCELADALYQAFTTPGDNGEPLQLVHRDLKPANVMLTPSGEVKVLDFGLARVDNDEFRPDDPDRIKGTMLYMAPEQACGEEVDHRTDLFALGLILYELLLSKSGYQIIDDGRDPLAATMAAIEAGDLSKQCAELESLLPKLGPVVSRSLQPRPRDRYTNGQALLVDLQRQLYRDRGAYLSEFCEFFFGTIHDLASPPTLDTIKATGKPVSTGRKRLSIEERLRQSMAGEKSTAKTPSKQQRPSIPVSRQESSMSSNSGGNKPPRPPIGQGASRFASGDSRPRKPLKEVGKRSPDETGMLEMAPLSVDQDTADASDDPSATQFFAIPAPKAERTAAPPPPGPGNFQPPPPAGPPIGHGPPGGVPRPPIGAPPAPAGGIRSGGPMIQGPVATQGGGATPFQVSGQQPGQNSQALAQQRVQSNRVYAIIFAVFMLVCMAVFVAIWIPRWVMGDNEPAEEVVASNNLTGNASGSKKKKVEAADTGEVAPAPKPKKRSSSRSGSSSRSSSSSSSSGSSAARAPTGPAPLRVTMADANQATSVEVTCSSSGFRQRAAISGNTATVSNVPQESCTLHFKGGAPAKYSPVRGGQSLSCNIIGTTGVCK